MGTLANESPFEKSSISLFIVAGAFIRPKGTNLNLYVPISLDKVVFKLQLP